MEAPIDMYYFPASPPCRAVLMLARALGVVLNLKFVNLMEGEQMKPEYLKINPMHSVPAMDDGGYVLWESKAILNYLEIKYDKENVYKPGNSLEQGKIDQILFFDGATLFPRLQQYMVPVIMGEEQPNNEKLARIEEALKATDHLLKGNKYAAGPHLTIADFALTPTISTLEAIKVDLTPYGNIMAWHKRVRNDLPGFDDINKKGAEMLGTAFNARAG